MFFNEIKTAENLNLGGSLMAVATNKRSIMTLFSDTIDIYSHQVRIVLAEKGVGVEISYIEKNNLSEDLIDLNPYGTVPTKEGYEFRVLGRSKRL